eukprot:TRINITY_DN92742_c4_g1_i1.p1 TRINITY_DN92742_c4_g1~~TRINITY_DN92742_c4_g1_i1.p1  ORF type:complete len:112 (-),score=17.25 TRINITY_DN92742_c4_g1_i1:44-379(-)
MTIHYPDPCAPAARNSEASEAEERPGGDTDSLLFQSQERPARGAIPTHSTVRPGQCGSPSLATQSSLSHAEKWKPLWWCHIITVTITAVSFRMPGHEARLDTNKTPFLLRV